MKTKNFAVLLGLVFFSCAHSAQKSNLDSKLAQESAFTDYESLRKEAAEAVKVHPGISEDQKTQLIDLKLETSKKMESFQLEILKLKGALMKNIVADRYDAKEVRSIESRLDTLTTQKLHAFYEALEKGRKILGKTSAREEVLNDLGLDRDYRFNREGSTGR
ncbi:MAG: hypothetical protein JNL01_16205 [Bdellovibrionales bacterium]|nr:hypothetical protein [Bdellovibrionales bacterium]